MNDKEILNLIQKDKNDGFRLLVDYYSRPIYWHVRKILWIHEDADDITQNVFIKVFLNLNTFKGNSSLKTWIYKIATNEALNYLNSAAKKRGITESELVIQLTANLKEDPFFDGNEIQIKLQKAIGNLPPKQQLIFNMKYFDNMKYEEISEILNTSVGALKASYHHATKKIEEYLLTSLDTL